MLIPGKSPSIINQFISPFIDRVYGLIGNALHLIPSFKPQTTNLKPQTFPLHPTLFFIFASILIEKGEKIVVENEDILIKRCIQWDREAQNRLYKLFAPK